MSAPTFSWLFGTVVSVQMFRYIGFSSRKTKGACEYNMLKDIDTGMPNGNDIGFHDESRFHLVYRDAHFWSKAQLAPLLPLWEHHFMIFF